MTVSIIVPGATFTKFSRNTAMPYIADVSGYFLLGGSAGESIVNRAINKTGTPSVVGSPAFPAAGYATLSPVNGIDVGFNHGRPYTYLVVARLGAGTRGIIGAWTPGGADVAAVNLLLTENGALKHAIDGLFRPGTLSIGSPTDFRLFAATYDGARSVVYAHNGSTLLSAPGAYVSAAVQPTTNPRIGASAFGGGEFDVAAAVLNDRAMTADEIGQLYAYLKPLLATRGVSVL